MNKPVHYSTFMSVKSDACDQTGDAMFQAMNRAHAIIDAFRDIKSDDDQHLESELINITNQKCRNGKWIAISLIKMDKWVTNEHQVTP
jgi:ribosomal protein S3AE